MVREAMNKEAMKQDCTETQNQTEPRESPMRPSIQDKASPSPSHHGQNAAKSCSPSKSPSNSRLSYSPSKSLSTSKSQTPANLKSSSPSQSSNPSAKSKSVPKSESTSSSHTSSSSQAREKKRPRDDSVTDGSYNQLKEKHPSLTSGSPVKKATSQHHPGKGTATVQVKRENGISGEQLKSHSSQREKKIVKEAHLSVKPRDKSHDKSHDTGASGSGVKKSSEHKLKSPSGHNPAPHGKQLTSKDGNKEVLHSKKTSQAKSLPQQRTESDKVAISSNSKDTSLKVSSHQSKSETTLEKTAKQATLEKLTSSVSASPGKSPSHGNKTDFKGKKMTVTTLRSSDKATAKASDLQGLKSKKSQPSSTHKKPNENLLGENEAEELDGQDFVSTGMSFGDCLEVPLASKVKKVTKSKPSGNLSNSTKPGHGGSTSKHSITKLKEVSKTIHKSSSSPGQSKVKGCKFDPNKPGVKVESSSSEDRGKIRDRDGNQAKPDVRKGESSSEGQGSDGGQRSKEGRRHRKKRSMSEEDEEAIILAKKVTRVCILF